MERKESCSVDELSDQGDLSPGLQYSVKVCQGFIDMLADSREHVDPPDKDLLQILWTECPRSTLMSEWRPDLDRHVRAVLLDWSNEMFHRLRADFIDALYAKYNARLIRIKNETLTFVFLHQDQDMKRMMAEKKWLHKQFSELLRTDPKLKLKINVSVKRIPSSTGTEQSANGGQTAVPSFRDKVQKELREIRVEAAAMKEVLTNILREVQELENEENVIPDHAQGDVGAAVVVNRANSSDIKTCESLSNDGASANNGIGESRSAENHLHEGKKDSKPDQNGLNARHETQTIYPQSHLSHQDQRLEYQQQQREQFAKYKKEHVQFGSTHQDGNPGQVTVKSSIRGLRHPSESSSSSASKHVANQMDEEMRSFIISNNYHRAEILLNGLGVDTNTFLFAASTRRFIESVAIALEPESPPPPKATAMSTLLCLDISESIGSAGLQELQTSVLKYVEGIEQIAVQYDLEENIGVVLMGEGGAWVAQQFTTNYRRIKEVIDNLTCRGPSPMFEALCVCVAAIKEKCFTLSIGMIHDVQPRIVVFTDGRPTPTQDISGRDSSNTGDLGVKMQVTELVRNMVRHEDANPIIWVPVGLPDKDFLASLAALGDTQTMDSKDTRSLCNYYRIEVAVGKTLLSYQDNGHLFDNEEAAIGRLSETFVYDMAPDEKERVRKRAKYKLDSCNEVPENAGNDDYRNIVMVDSMPPIGSRVIRGPDWRYGNQDSGGPGTIINHTKGKQLLWVKWDNNKTNCQYRYGFDGYDVLLVDDQPKFLPQDELIDIGVRVKRGPNWHYDNQDGGEGSTGVVIRTRMDGKVKVRWEDGSICDYDFGFNGTFDLAICEPEDFMKALRPEPVAKNNKELSAEIAETSNKSAQSYPVWQWKDDEGVWHVYSEEQMQKLEDEFTTRPTGSCVIQKNNQGYRVLFKLPMVEKCITSGGTHHDVKRTLVSRKQKRKMVKTRAS